MQALHPVSHGLLRLAQRAAAGLVLAASPLLLAGPGCSSASNAADECCLAAFPGSTTPYCLCGSFDAPGVNCTVATNAGACTISCNQGGKAMTAEGATASSCEGQPTPCFNSSGFGTQGACTDGYAQCVDGHTYEFDCTGTSCTCKVDKAVTKTVTGSCGDENALCGWNITG